MRDWKVDVMCGMFLAAMLIGALLQSCVTNPKDVGRFINENRDWLRLSVTLAVGITLEKEPSLAEGMHEVASALANDTRDQYTSLDLAMKQVKNLIEARPTYQERPPSQKLVIQELLVVMESRLADYLAKKGIDAPEELQVYIQEVAGWVRDAAALYLK